MNYLAHAYLSFNLPEILAGNMVSDFVKGKQKLEFPVNIQTGIQLHRAIDQFTDEHAATKAAKQFFRPAYGLYAGAFMDIVYDHFLATDEKEFKDGELLSFSLRTYEQLDQYMEWFPPRFALMYPYMKDQNWLYNYKNKTGIHNSLKGLVHRAAYINNSQPAIGVFEKHYHSFYNYYLNFFPEIKLFVQDYLTTNFAKH